MSRPSLSAVARLVFALSIGMVLAQAISFVVRGRSTMTDFGVFYRSALLLRTGIGAEFYPRHDPVTDWLATLAPTGLMMIQPLVRLGPTGASLVWAGFNLALAAVSLVALRRLLTTVGGRAEAVWPWAASIFLLLSAGSIQIGQFSLLCAACWLLLLNVDGPAPSVQSGLLLALPGAIKAYPLMMGAVPLSTARGRTAVVRLAAGVVFGLLVTALLLPALMYGGRAWVLELSFLRNVVFSSTGPMDYVQTLRTPANQSIDTVLLRYLTYAPDFHDHYGPVPHLQFARSAVLRGADVLRAAILLTTSAAVVRWRRAHAHATFSAHDRVLMAGLWSSALYLMLPEAKARYAVYAFLGFLPLLEVAAAQTMPVLRRTQVAAIVIGLFLVGGAMPLWLQTYGAGVAGVIGLWWANLTLIVRAARVSPGGCP